MMCYTKLLCYRTLNLNPRGSLFFERVQRLREYFSTQIIIIKLRSNKRTS